MLRLAFKTDNASFGETLPELRDESASILRTIADQIASGRQEAIIRDVYGNRVGDWELETPDYLR